MGNAVTDNAAMNRYEMITDGGLAFIRYRAVDKGRNLFHAEVPKSVEGHGVGSALARGTLDLVRMQGFKIIPGCPFVAAYIAKHPEFRDLVAS